MSGAAGGTENAGGDGSRARLPTAGRKKHATTHKLAPVGVRARVGHRQDAGARVLEREVLVRELHAVDRLAARAVAGREVAALFFFFGFGFSAGGRAGGGGGRRMLHVLEARPGPLERRSGPNAPGT